jgi:hypothetical protein
MLSLSNQKEFFTLKEIKEGVGLPNREAARLIEELKDKCFIAIESCRQ